MKAIACSSIFVCLAFLAPWSVEAQSPSPCDTVAKAVSSFKPSPGWPYPWSSPINTSEALSGDPIRLYPEEWRGKTADEFLAKLRDGYHAQPDLLDAAKSYSSDWFRREPTITRFGKSSLHLAEIVQGTDLCQYFVFFDSSAGGPAHLMAGPPIVGRDGGKGLCLNQHGFAGEIDGVPAFIVQDDRDNTVELSVTPWRNGAWKEACRVTLTYHSDFKATERYCNGVDCDRMADLAQWLAQELDKRSPQAADIFDVRKLAPDNGLAIHLPTFGSKMSGAHYDDDTEFANDTIFVPIVVGGTMYLARIGHAGMGWRVWPDYLFAAYRMTGDHLEPVAGIYVGKSRSGLADVKVD